MIETFSTRTNAVSIKRDKKHCKLLYNILDSLVACTLYFLFKLKFSFVLIVRKLPPSDKPTGKVSLAYIEFVLF